MLDLTGTSIATSEANGNPFCFKVEVKWDGSSWSDESGYVSKFAFEASTGDIPGSASASRFSVTFYDHTFRFQEGNARSPLHDYIKDSSWYGKEIRLLAGFRTDSGSPEYVTRFHGYIVDWLENEDETTVEALDLAFPLLTRTFRTPLLRRKPVHEAISSYLSYIPASIRPSLASDLSYVTVPVCWADNDNIWEEICSLAAVEGGAVYLSPSGVLRFYNAERFLGIGDPDIAIPWCRKVSTEPQADKRANLIRVSYYAPLFQPESVVWTLREPILIGPNDSKSIRTHFELPVLQPYCASFRATNQSGFDVTSSVNVSVSAYAQEMTITFSHSLSFPVVVHSAEIIGSYVALRDEQTVTAIVQDGELDFSDSAIDNAVNVRSYEIRRNWYIQTVDAAERLVYLWGWRLSNGLTRYIFQQPGRKFWLDPLDLVLYQGHGPTDERFIISKVQLAYSAFPIVVLEGFRVSQITPDISFFRLGIDTVGGDAVYFL